MKQFIAGLMTGALLLLLLSTPGTRDHISEKVIQVSGEKIGHKNFDYTGDIIKFNTHAEGEGEIITEIPKTNIPEARAWIENNNAVSLELLLAERRMYGVTYLHRWNNLSAGGGIILSEKRFEGVKIQAQYWFKL